MKKNNSIKKKHIKTYPEPKIKTRKKKKSKKGLIYNNVDKKVKSNIKSPYLKIRSYKKTQTGGGCTIKYTYSIPGKKKKKEKSIYVNKINKSLIKTNKKLVKINKKMDVLIRNLKLKKEICEPFTVKLIKYLKLVYYSEKLNFILNIKREVLNNNLPGLISKIKKKEDKELFKFSVNKADMDNILGLLNVVDKELTTNKDNYFMTFSESEDKYKSYNEEYAQLKKILNIYFYEIYCINTLKKKRVSFKKYDYQNIGKTNTSSYEIGKNISISQEVAFIKSKLESWDKIKDIEKGTPQYKTLNKTIKKMVDKYKECGTIVKNVVDTYTKLFNETDEKERIINELNLFIGSLFTHKADIKIKMNGKDIELGKIFNYKENNSQGNLFMKSLFLLAPIKVDPMYQELDKIKEFEENRKNVIDYKKLKEVEDAFENIHNTKNKIPFNDFHKHLFVQLTKAEELFKISHSIYKTCKKDLLTFSELFFFTGKNYEHHNTSYLKKFIGDIISSHYIGLFILINVKNFIKNFEKKEERQKFTEIFIKTDIEARMLGSYNQQSQQMQLRQYQSLRGGNVSDIDKVLNVDYFKYISDKQVSPYYVRFKDDYHNFINSCPDEDLKNKKKKEFSYIKELFYTKIKDKIEKDQLNDIESLNKIIHYQLLYL